ncbi:MAG: hypothetical protein E2O56_03910 [Gammaproteobacteria bacterium]|nr:MAG: hypothetical protein E2O56_03910 [Gammaproteobacteria bacterium]
MKLLVFHAKSFRFEPEKRSSELGPEAPPPGSSEITDALVAFVHCEPRDANRRDAVIKQAVKYFEWLSRKRELSKFLLHSFAHLDEERAPPEVALDLLGTLAEQLRGKGFEVLETPFGWSLSWTLATPGHPHAKTFKVL